MNCLRRKILRIACALFTCFVITGDILADAVHDATGACATESQSGCETCPACGCSIHTGTAVAPDLVALVSPITSTREWMAAFEEALAVGPAAAIDHPPQLS